MLLLAACATPTSLGPTSLAAPSPSFTMAPVASAKVPDAKPSVAATAPACADDGAFGFRVWGSTLGRYDGARIHVAAIEPHRGHEDHRTVTTRYPVNVATTIAEGRFEVNCPNALQQSMAYPTWALWIDVDGDGACGDHDVGMIRALYGWDRTIDTQVGPGTRDEASMSGKLLSLSELGTTWLCSRFFPSAR